MKQSKSNANRWNDHYARRARKEHFPARSVYKLKEMQQKYHLIKKGDRVLDLGCAPGAWLLYAAGLVGEKGRVVGIDLKGLQVKLPTNVRLLRGDVLAKDEVLLAAAGTNFDVVMSDMAPATTGNRIVDTARSFNLCQAALTLAGTLLVPGGMFVCKIFHGGDFKVFTDSVRIGFAACKIFKPRSTRKASREIFIIGIGKKPLSTKL